MKISIKKLSKAIVYAEDIFWYNYSQKNLPTEEKIFIFDFQQKELSSKEYMILAEIFAGAFTYNELPNIHISKEKWSAYALARHGVGKNYKGKNRNYTYSICCSPVDVHGDCLELFSRSQFMSVRDFAQDNMDFYFDCGDREKKYHVIEKEKQFSKATVKGENIIYTCYENNYLSDKEYLTLALILLRAFVSNERIIIDDSLYNDCCKCVHGADPRTAENYGYSGEIESGKIKLSIKKDPRNIHRICQEIFSRTKHKSVYNCLDDDYWLSLEICKLK